jgi:putative endonuclease
MYVYLICSAKNPNRRYVGMTRDFERRLKQHNTGAATATYKFRPWRCVVKVWFDSPEKAASFESYLKCGSGRSFADRHFW